MTHPFLELKNVKKNYYEKENLIKKAVNGISFTIQSGEVLGLLGVNGAGKTTTSSIIASLIPLTSGDVLWNGESIYRVILEYRRILGFCPQKPNLDHFLTLEQMLTFSGRYFGLSPDVIKKRKDYLIEKFDLGDYAKLKSFVLSGGYKQRFSIARTLMHSPKLVILDEPTVGLDPHVRHQLWEFIRSLKNDGITTILTTHYLDEAEVLCDRVCIIDAGEILKIDTPDILKADHKHSKLEDVFLELIKNKAESNEE